MGRLIGAKHRMCRRVGERLCSTDRCPVARRHAPPGMHGQKGYGKLTEFGTQLKEKQKAKYLYGVMEKQFRGYYEKASSQTGNTAQNFLSQLERRLDNTVYRLGFAKTRASARQLVNHGWILVDGKRVTIPSFLVKPGNIITIDPQAKGRPIGETAAKGGATTPSWLAADPAEMKGKVVSLPAAEDFPPNLNMTLVVEFYSR